MNDMGARVVSGNSKGHAVIKKVWGGYVGFGIFLFILGMLVSSQWAGHNIHLGNFALDVGTIIRIFAFALPAFCLINAAVYHSQVSKTEISVFERGVTGVGINPKSASDKFTYPIFKTPTYTSSSFNLTYDQISSTSISEQQGVTLNISGVIYVILVSNPDEILREINNRMKNRQSRS